MSDQFSEEHPPTDVISQMYEKDHERRMIEVGLKPGQWDVLEEAFKIYMDRNGDRADAWKDAGYKGQLVEMRKKLDRLWAGWRVGRKPTTKDIDEALDLINAAAFYVQLARLDEANGKWPWP